MSNVKNNFHRGDFYFRDVYNRNTYASFAENGYSDRSTLYINQNDEAIPCTSEVSTLNNGVGDLHIYTRKDVNFDKSNVAQAALSINALTTTLRSSNTHITGGFSVGVSLKVGPQNVGVNTDSPQFILDVKGDCNVKGGGGYRINGAPVLSSTALGPSVMASSLVTTMGNVQTLTVHDLNLTGNLAINGEPVTFEHMSAEYGTDTPFIYEGPGNDMTNGVPFYALIARQGAAFVSSSALGTYTFSREGTYIVQVEIRGGYPWLPEGDVLTYFLKNGLKLGLETHKGGGLFCYSKSYVMKVAATDSVKFIIESATTNECSIGIDSCKIEFVMHDIRTTGGTMSTLTVGNVDVLGRLTVNGAQWASTVVYGTTSPFMYTGPGAAATNGVSFYLQQRANGTVFVQSGGVNNSVFTFLIEGTYILQAEFEIGHPSMPAGDITSFFLVNGNARFGVDSSANFSCTRPYLIPVDASDNVRFVIDSSSGNDFEVGLVTTRLTILKLA